MGKLVGKIALVTGATSGIGEASARLFAEEGAEVIIVGRNKERGELIEKAILQSGNRAKFYCCDVTQKNEIDSLYERLSKDYDKIDILFNNAGILITSALENIQIEDWDKTFDTNSKSIMLMTQKFIDKIIASHGNILNCASIEYP